uniref:Uncharacterized protein n=1 Tax=Laticauda laticaudata TaxID=8630 RepID=A0A8C5STA1_LATLA
VGKKSSWSLFPVCNRGRLAEKRTIPLPPSRTPKKEPPTLFSHSDNHKEVEKINGHHPHVKQEEDLHISIMKRRRLPRDADVSPFLLSLSLSLLHSQNGDLTSFLSSLNQSRQLGMPETQNRCEFKRSSLEVGLGAAGKWHTGTQRESALCVCLHVGVCVCVCVCERERERERENIAWMGGC